MYEKALGEYLDFFEEELLEDDYDFSGNRKEMIVEQICKNRFYGSFGGNTVTMKRRRQSGF